jgi:hypothetical protein
MRVLLKLVLDCPPDAAWRAIRDPLVFAAVSAPLTVFESLEPHGFPELWEPGEHPVAVSAAGLVHIGDQVIDVSFEERPGVRLMHDTGRGLSGPLALITRWDHTMAIAPTADGRTLYRDQLIVEAGVLTPLLWPMYWAFWQWRAIGLRRLARDWF